MVVVEVVALVVVVAVAVLVVVVPAPSPAVASDMVLELLEDIAVDRMHQASGAQ